MSSLVKLCKYNLWANQKITEYILAAGESIVDMELQSSFPTIRKTLYHIWDAQKIWYVRLHGESLSTWPGRNFTGSLSEGCNAFLQSSSEFVDFTEKYNGNFSVNLSYKTLDGHEFNNTIENP